ncbi:MAG: hypothetical protein IK063_04800, partial [Clostridia bacterium]|nr:hypothetical protein [Clostridia bacterium]
PLGGTAISPEWISGFKNTNSALSASAATADGGMVAAGSSVEGSSSQADIVKFDAEGSKVWSDTIKGEDSIAFRDVAVLSDGSVVAVGYTFENAEGKGAGDCLIVNYTADGRREWIKTLGGTKSDMFYSVAACPEGGFVAGGTVKSTDGDFADVSKIDAQEQASAVLIRFADNDCSSVSWSKSMSSSKYACVEDLAVAGNGDVFASIDIKQPDYDFENIPDKDTGSEKTLVIKYSGDGTEQWQRTLCSSARTYMPSITAGSDGGCAVAGYYTAAVPSEDNNLGCQGTFASVFNGGDPGTPDGAVVSLDSDGNIKWLTVLVGFYSDYITDIVPVSGGYAVSGYSGSTNRDFSSMPGAGDYDAFVYMLSSDGAKQNLLGLGGSDADKILSICAYEDGSVGFCGSTASADGDFEITPAGSAESAAAFAGKAAAE